MHKWLRDNASQLEELGGFIAPQVAFLSQEAREVRQEISKLNQLQPTMEAHHASVRGWQTAFQTHYDDLILQLTQRVTQLEGELANASTQFTSLGNQQAQFVAEQVKHRAEFEAQFKWDVASTQKMVHEQVQGQVTQGLRELERRVLAAETQRFQAYEERLAQLEHLFRERPSWNEWEERLEAVEGALPSSSPGFLASPPPVPEPRIPHLPATVPIHTKGLFRGSGNAPSGRGVPPGVPPLKLGSTPSPQANAPAGSLRLARPPRLDRASFPQYSQFESHSTVSESAAIGGLSAAGVRVVAPKVPVLLQPLVSELLKRHQTKVFSGNPLDFPAWKKAWEEFLDAAKTAANGATIPDKTVLGFLESWLDEASKRLLKNRLAKDPELPYLEFMQELGREVGVGPIPKRNQWRDVKLNLTGGGVEVCRLAQLQVRLGGELVGG